MGKRTDIQTILIIGSGPIVIGQACEFDYSGTQGLKALREEGYRVVLVNSNPATIMTDPQLADRTYVEPLNLKYLELIIEAERPQAILPTLGGQTALNLAVEAAEQGVLKKYQVELIGANFKTIKLAEDRELFKGSMQAIGVDLPKSRVITDISGIKSASAELGFPIIVRPSFTLGGTGGGIAYHPEELHDKVRAALEASPVKKILLEESVIGWKEYELEVMRDRSDNFVVVCSIENFDPMGVHTGDSITVAPAQTLTDRQYQELRDEAKRIVSAIGVETGGCNIQFAVNPETGRRVAIEINPRVSRSSALASKATGFPIAKIAAKLAVGYRLDEIHNDVTKRTLAGFEPALDYVVVKAPRFAFEKFGEFPLDTAMKSVGETMAIGRTFKEALQKALRGLETGKMGLEFADAGKVTPEELTQKLALPSSSRLYYIKAALEQGWKVDLVAQTTRIDSWFLHQIKEIVDFENGRLKHERLDRELLRDAKRLGFSDAQLDGVLKKKSGSILALRKTMGLAPSYRLVDTCAGEFESSTPYFYSTYEDASDLKPSRSKKKVIILGSGPNRIGQGIEFDYCCVQAAMALREIGYESIMVNSNPETVSTDYDISNRLYFEPLTLEDVLEVLAFEKPLGVIVQLGGQTPLNLTLPLAKAGVRILGTAPADIDRAEDRKLFGALVRRLGLPAPAGGIARSAPQAAGIARRIGYPVIVRPSYVLGGRSMEILYDEPSLREYLARFFKSHAEPRHPAFLVDRFLTDATEVDVDAVCDGRDVFIAGVMEHIEEAGIHSGDSACTLPPHSLPVAMIDRIKGHTRKLALALGVRGLLNIQFAIKDGVAYILEANPRASRTVPFVSKATGIPLAKIATLVIIGRKLKTLMPANLLKNSPPDLSYVATKEVVFPFHKFPGVDPRVGPEMKSTGEVMGLDADFQRSFIKSQEASGLSLPLSGSIFISVRDQDKPQALEIARALKSMGFSLVATHKTHDFLSRHAVASSLISKIGEGKPDVVDLLKQRSLNLILNTPSGQRARSDGYAIRRTALDLNIPCMTNIHRAQSAVHAIAVLKKSQLGVKALQDYYRELPYAPWAAAS